MLHFLTETMMTNFTDTEQFVNAYVTAVVQVVTKGRPFHKLTLEELDGQIDLINKKLCIQMRVLYIIP